MTNRLRVMVESGPKGKKVAALSPDWPGLTRGARSEDAAVEHLRRYIPRYAAIAELAGLANEYPATSEVEIVERYVGTGSTDFWGIPFGRSSFDLQPMTDEDVERELALLEACWTFFDDVRSRVSAELQKGPRGGGRDRDQIVRHVLVNEFDWATKVGVRTPDDAIHSADALREHRTAYCDAIRAFHAEGKNARTWPLRFLIRHTAYHLLDHAWEMEDKDLTGKAQ